MRMKKYLRPGSSLNPASVKINTQWRACGRLTGLRQTRIDSDLVALPDAP
jgi:hypothetical protein